MKINELRIGNYVMDFEGNPGKTIMINKSGSVRTEFNLQHVSKLKPIPITDELFVKSNFKKEVNIEIQPTRRDKSFYYVQDNIIITRFEINDRIYFEFDFRSFECGTYINTIIKYVHQLQNLYFALTGKELKIIL